MATNQGNITLTFPSGASVKTTPRYRFVLAIDAGPGSWVERRSDSKSVLEKRRDRMGAALYTASHIFDLEVD